jgi:dTDP-4-amino-4,6-dideoxygalactose transaminase
VRVVSDSSTDGTLDNPRRDALIARLQERSVGSMCYYPVPLHVQEAFKNLGYKMGDFPISERLSREVLSLPMYPELTEAQVEYVARSIEEVMKESKQENLQDSPANQSKSPVAAVI